MDLEALCYSAAMLGSRQDTPDGGQWAACGLLALALIAAYLTGPGDFVGTMVFFVGWSIVLLILLVLLAVFVTSLATIVESVGPVLVAIVRFFVDEIVAWKARRRDRRTAMDLRACGFAVLVLLCAFATGRGDLGGTMLHFVGWSIVLFLPYSWFAEFVDGIVALNGRDVGGALVLALASGLATGPDDFGGRVLHLVGWAIVLFPLFALVREAIEHEDNEAAADRESEKERREGLNRWGACGLSALALLCAFGTGSGDFGSTALHLAGWSIILFVLFESARVLLDEAAADRESGRSGLNGLEVCGFTVLPLLGAFATGPGDFGGTALHLLGWTVILFVFSAVTYGVIEAAISADESRRERLNKGGVCGFVALALLCAFATGLDSFGGTALHFLGWTVVLALAASTWGCIDERVAARKSGREALNIWELCGFIALAWLCAFATGVGDFGDTAASLVFSSAILYFPYRLAAGLVARVVVARRAMPE